MLRQVTRRDEDRQVHILTTRDAAGLPAAGVVYRMTSRWREENYIRYARAHFALDSYAITTDNPGCLVPNPARKTAAAAVKTAKKALAEAESARQRKLDALRRPAPGSGAMITNAMLAGLDARSTPPAARLENRPGSGESHASENLAQPAQPGHGPVGRRNQADYSRHPDGRLQR